MLVCRFFIMEIIPLIYLLSCCAIVVTSKQIIIIGAGASGIAAATRLIENNITDFEILEAESRLGGRIHSILLKDRGKDIYVDLGGEYVGGREGNVVYEFAKGALQLTNNSKVVKAFYSDGKPISNTFSDEILTFRVHLRGWYEDQKPISTADAFFKSYNSTILKKYESNPEYLQEALDFAKTCEKIFIISRGSFDWNKLILNDHYKFFKDGSILSWNGRGYRHFLDLLMKKFDDEKRFSLYPITYSTTVSKIIWNKNNKLLLSTRNGGTYEADHVIFTPSLGVLKKNHEEMFEPNLPKHKADAIKRTGFDASMKIILQYTERWWGEDVSEYLFVWNNKDIERVDSGRKTLSKKSWISSIHSLATVPGVSNVLILWIAGPQVPYVEKIPIQQLQDGVDYVIRKFLGNDYNITSPSVFLPSNWYSNPNFLGTYSYETIESTDRKRQVQEDLADPLLNTNGVPVVIFAGEHTSKTHFSTVQGAAESGYRAADELIEYLNKGR